MDYRKQATELADLLEKTSVDYFNKNIAIDFIERELRLVEEKVKKLIIPSVSNCGTGKKEKALIWWQDLIENDLCEHIEKKHGYYGHDIGTNEKDIIRMYEMECDCR
mgnify:CR=1 FL=1